MFLCLCFGWLVSWLVGWFARLLVCLFICLFDVFGLLVATFCFVSSFLCIHSLIHSILVPLKIFYLEFRRFSRSMDFYWHLCEK